MDTFTSKLETSTKENSKFKDISDEKSALERLVNGLTHIHILHQKHQPTLKGKFEDSLGSWSSQLL